MIYFSMKTLCMIIVVTIHLTYACPIFSEIVYQKIRLESKNYPGYFLRHRNYEMWLDKKDSSQLYDLDSSFQVVSGLNGEGVSFRSKNYPDHYVRHRGYKCYINKSDGSSLFKKDATWIPRASLAGDGTTSFESSNYPDYYMRHSGYRLRIDKNDHSDIFKKDASWEIHLLDS